MKLRTVITAAVIFGLLTAVFVYTYLNNLKKSMDHGEKVKVVVAKQDLQARTLITAAMVEEVERPKEFVHAQAFSDLKEAVGQLTLIPVVSGEELLKSQVVRPGETRQGLAYRVPVGKRAVAVAVNEVSGVGGMLKPGDRVDVVATVDLTDGKGGDKKTYTVVSLQDIEVLAVGTNLQETSPGGKGDGASSDTKKTESKTVTLAVTVEQARPLVIAAERGAIRLMLRSPADQSKVSTSPFELHDLLQVN
ncbi:MAG: Flp pilus assembly protein CpaB [Firmicutes bacterium]|nr:Flp pilus assembly protein CpaB [Bacillota bacterium]